MPLRGIQVLCVRNDLKMTKGKACAQCGHATLGAYGYATPRMDHEPLPSCRTADDESIDRWMTLGEAKIALRVSSEKELHELKQKATDAGLNNYLVADAGNTQLEPGTETVLAIGPGMRAAWSSPNRHS